MITQNRRYLFLLGGLLFLLACALPGLGEPQATPTLVIHDPTINALETLLMQPTASFTPQSSPTATLTPAAPTDTSAPADTATPTEDPLAKCLIGTWRATNIQDYVIAAIPAGMVEQYKPAYKNSSGQVDVTFFENGMVTIQASQLALEFDIQASIFRVGLTISLDGVSGGEFVTNGDQLTTRNMSSTGMTASAKSLGQDVVTSESIVNSLPLVKPPFDQATYQCVDQTLLLKLIAYPDSIPPLMFQRQP
jgi:hypothetical protein